MQHRYWRTFINTNYFWLQPRGQCITNLTPLITKLLIGITKRPRPDYNNSSWKRLSLFLGSRTPVCTQIFAKTYQKTACSIKTGKPYKPELSITHVSHQTVFPIYMRRASESMVSNNRRGRVLNHKQPHEKGPIYCASQQSLTPSRQPSGLWALQIVSNVGQVRYRGLWRLLSRWKDE